MINNELFRVKEFPKFIPDSSKFLEFWRSIKRHCIEGYWVGGKWMPGIVYQYINIWHIGLKENEYSKSEIISRPFLRDLEWEKGYLFVEARGFSGFSLDDKYTCNEKVRDLLIDEQGNIIQNENINQDIELSPSCFNKDGKLKKYQNPRDYLRKIHHQNLGKPLYENQAKNVVDIESRGTGKSYWASNMIAHNFLFDGATDYDEYIRRRQEEKNMLKSETLIGAIDYKYTADLIKKFWIGIDNLPGAQEYNKKKYNSPLFIEYTGSLATGSTITSQREVKIGNNWVTKGSKSMVHNRSFGDNPFAASGTRPNLILLEEVGFMGNLIESLGTIRDTQMNGSFKMGTTWMFGTGGDMEGGSTEAVKEVFYNPEEYDCIFFEDEWENLGKIGLFVPAHMGLNDCKNSEGNTDKVKAKKKIEDRREKVKHNPKAYLKELENRPEKPSEAFMTSDDNMFPIQDCKDRLAELETDSRILNSVWIGHLKLGSDGKVAFAITDKKPILDFPLKKDQRSSDLTGAIQIFEHPYETDGRPPKGLYLAGLDPYDDDTGTSLGSMFIMNSITGRIVAEYTGRPPKVEEFYEICRRMLIYYNADCCYENNKKGFFGYMDKKNSLHYLADTPKVLKDVENTTFHESGNKSKGFNATENVNKYNRQLYKHWLMEDIYTQEEYDNLPTNAAKIKSPALLKETIAWNKKGNFDRISAIGACLLLREDRAKRIIDLEEENNNAIKDDFFSRHFS
jgi:hypothetical protein